jgi:hypothetical protein
VDVWVGISAACLNFVLTNCILPEESWAYNPAVEATTVQRVIIQSASREAESRNARRTANRVSFGLSGGTVGATAKSTKARERDTRNQEVAALETRDTFPHVAHLLQARGNSEAPSWHVEAPPSEPILKGTILQDMRFAQAYTVGPNPTIKVDIELPKHGVVIRDHIGNLDKLPNKKGLTKWLLTRHLCSRPIELSVTALTANNGRSDVLQ